MTLLTVKQAAKILAMSPETLRRWENEGRIESSRTAGGHRRFQQADVEALLADIKQGKFSERISRQKNAPIPDANGIFKEQAFSSIQANEIISIKQQASTKPESDNDPETFFQEQLRSIKDTSIHCLIAFLIIGGLWLIPITANRIAILGFVLIFAVSYLAAAMGMIPRKIDANSHPNAAKHNRIALLVSGAFCLVIALSIIGTASRVHRDFTEIRKFKTQTVLILRSKINTKANNIKCPLLRKDYLAASEPSVLAVKGLDGYDFSEFDQHGSTPEFQAAAPFTNFFGEGYLGKRRAKIQADIAASYHEGNQPIWEKYQAYCQAQK